MPKHTKTERAKHKKAVTNKSAKSAAKSVIGKKSVKNLFRRRK